MSRIFSTKFSIVTFDGFENFDLWQRKVKDLLVQQSMVKVLCGKQQERMNDINWKDLEAKTVITIRLCLTNNVMYHIMDEESPATIW